MAKAIYIDKEDDDEIHYSIDLTMFEGIVKEMNELGAPITLGDFGKLIERKLTNGEAMGPFLGYPKYILICPKMKTLYRASIIKQ